MVDEEVENILAEIRDRVRGRESNSAATISTEDWGDASPRASLAQRESLKTPADEVLARIDSYLTVTSRAWDRLPPLVSNRSGGVAGIELWVKRKIKTVTHWFTWEQVNFNAAVHQALGDTMLALTTYQQALEMLRAETEAERSLLEENQATFEAQRAEVQSQRAQVKSQRKEMDARLAAIAREMSERIENLQNEQRVCFRQLSLEATETAVLEDRARRKAEKLIEELRLRLAQLES